MRKALLSSISIFVILLNGCGELPKPYHPTAHLIKGTKEYKAHQKYLALKKARLEREAAGNYTGYEKGTAEYIRRSDPKYISPRKKMLREHKAYEIRLAEAKRKREEAEKDPNYIARINRLKEIASQNKRVQYQAVSAPSYNYNSNSDLINSVDRLHRRLDTYESNAEINSINNTLIYNANRGMGF